MSEQPESPRDPIQILNDAIAQIADEGDFCAGFVLVCEWLEDSGGASLQVFHSPMSPWHLSGLLDYARETQCAPLVRVDEDDESWGED